MKRMSIAEQTLKKQIDRIDNDANKLHGEISILTARRDELIIQRRAVVAEQIREAAATSALAIAALEPFAAEVDSWGDQAPRDHHPIIVECGHFDARYYGSPAKYTIGDLDRARATIAKLRARQEGGDDSEYD